MFQPALAAARMSRTTATLGYRRGKPRWPVCAGRGPPRNESVSAFYHPDDPVRWGRADEGDLAAGDNPQGEQGRLVSLAVDSCYGSRGVCSMQRKVPASDLTGDPVCPHADRFPGLAHVGGVCWLAQARDGGGEARSETAERAGRVQAVCVVHGLVS